MEDKPKEWTASAMGRKGARARAEKLSKAERSQIAKKAALTRWKRVKKGKKNYRPD